MNSVSMRRLLAICSIGVALALLVLAGCGSSSKVATNREATPAESAPKEESASAYIVQDVPGGVIQGRVSLHGTTPPPRKIIVNQDPGVCGSQQQFYPVKVEKGGIVEALVFVDGIKRGKAFAFPEPILRQKRCTFTPHVVLMQPGELKIESDDPVPHNVHSYAESNRNYNESMNQLHRSLELRFSRPERFRIGCDLHGWMRAYVVVAANPYYAVTGEGGRFELDALPPGNYQLKVWQETLGEMEKDVVVEAGKTTKVDFTFVPKPTQLTASK